MSKGEAKKGCITDRSKSAEEDQQRSPKGRNYLQQAIRVKIIAFSSRWPWYKCFCFTLKQLKQLQNYSLSSNRSDEEADELFPAAEIENDPDESLADVHPLSEDAPLEENQDNTDPEQKLSEEEAEMDDDGDDEEKDTPVTRNTIK